MRPNDGTRAAAQVLIDQLALHGVRHVFCVPGESYIAALDALHDTPIAVTVCRQEGGAAIMAAPPSWRQTVTAMGASCRASSAAM